MSSGRDEQSERFSDARERFEPRRRTGPVAHGRQDPDLGPDFDMADLDLAAALREAARTVPGPDRDASARMRAGLMDAITGGAESDREAGGVRILGEPGERTTGARRPGSAGSRGAGRADRSRPRDDRPAGAPSRGARRAQPRSPRSRLMASALAGFCAVLVLGALTVVIGRGALPGQMLYGVKRASESVEMGLTSGPEARGQKNLQFAANRLDEISGLIQQDSTTAAGNGPVASGLDPETASLIAENLRSFDLNARDGSRLLLPLIGRSGGLPPSEVSDWARAQSVRLNSISPSLPAPQQANAADSRRLMDRLGARLSALDEHGRCDGASSAEDEFGPVPAACGGTERNVAAPAPSSTTSPSSTGPKKTTSKTSSEDPTSSERDTSRTSTTDSTSSSSTSRSDRGLLPTTPKAPVNVPLPVPGLPPVSVPPLVPGMPGLSLG